MDNTGVSHILEHTSLCGSKKFPVRDPFFRMLTRSTSNFMNAFTGPHTVTVALCILKENYSNVGNDWTMYIFSTKNFTDFNNLLSVYMDCVFFPNLRSLDFK